jgi:CDP-diacylglycerol--glycerol-3-phosphate 3-phosphatidyltransferase
MPRRVSRRPSTRLDWPMNLPNTLTLARIFLVPLLVVVLLTKFEGRRVLGFEVEIVGAAIFGLASLTDWLDGYLARRRGQVTWIGQVLDPIADKLLISAALISLVQLDLVPAWIVAVIIGREFAVTALRSLAFSRGLIIPASPLGKIKMGAQVVAILLLILGWERYPPLALLGKAALWVVLAAALVSALDYYRKFQRALGAAGQVTDFAAARARLEERKKIS